jgi:hypothetical protein
MKLTASDSIIFTAWSRLVFLFLAAAHLSSTSHTDRVPDLNRSFALFAP